MKKVIVNKSIVINCKYRLQLQLVFININKEINFRFNIVSLIQYDNYEMKWRIHY
jgi:hypothetical protein